ncbi:hypothetical protein BOO90_18535 [Vibrio navarrensis]|nr:hypothetical protein [Vibrio navarrensis]MBE4617010.1 hypothetical protein [Vibrio navarrensis]
MISLLTQGTTIASPILLAGQQIRIFKLLLLHGSWASSSFSPEASRCVLLTESGFVLKTDINSFKDHLARDRFDFEFFNRFDVSGLRIGKILPIGIVPVIA